MSCSVAFPATFSPSCRTLFDLIGAISNGFAVAQGEVSGWGLHSCFLINQTMYLRASAELTCWDSFLFLFLFFYKTFKLLVDGTQ
jgi:hypothetical protein